MKEIVTTLKNTFPLSISILVQISIFILTYILCEIFLPHQGNAQSFIPSNKVAAFVVDANTGQVLHEYLSTEPRHPASLTKMMTLYLLFEKIKSKKLSLSSTLVVSEKAASVAPSKLGVKAGSQVSIEDAIKALIVKSANDMAVAVAESISGNEIAFAKLMTEKAKLIGMKNTIFRNASGLPDKKQITTARDMVTLGLRLQNDYPEFYNLFALQSFSYDGKSYQNHNSLLTSFKGVNGIKTGYTRMSGFNLVTSFNANGKRIVGSVFGGVTASARDAHMRMLIALALEKTSISDQKVVNWSTQINKINEQEILRSQSSKPLIMENYSPNLNTYRDGDYKNSNLEKPNGSRTSPNLEPPPNKHAIQIGIFSTLDNAESALSFAQEQLGERLTTHPSQTIPTMRAGQFLYQAIFSNYEYSDALKACAELKAINTDCIVIKTP